MRLKFTVYFRCISYIWYYPIQPVPYTGACGLGVCDGKLDEVVLLADDSDLDRTFGILNGTCEEYSGQVATLGAVEAVAGRLGVKLY